MKRLLAMIVTLLNIVPGLQAQHMIGGHEGIDLELPSGTLWATMNVGATTAEESGLYFAWGETTGHSFNASNCFEWEYYEWCNRSSTHTQLTKYCHASSFGTIDNKMVLDLEDDAAYVNWGEKWHTPTIEQIEELISNTTQEWTAVSGVNGTKFTSNTNGRWIFLPAAGYGEGYMGEVAYWHQDEYGHYWSSSLYGQDSRLARNLTTYRYDVIACTNTEGRIHGCTVRPVSGYSSTGISIINKPCTDKKDIWYDLSGRRIVRSTTKKGLYIQGRRQKIVIK